MFGRRRGLPEGWESIVDAHVAHWRELDEVERNDLAYIADWLLKKKHWEAARGFELTDEIRVTIAAQAALLVLGLDLAYYHDVSAIIVWPTTIMMGGEHAGPVEGTVSASAVELLGESHDRSGPVLIAWDEARRNARDPERGHNVVYHEFAHKIDMADGWIDGTPDLGDRNRTQRWVDVCTEVYDDLRAGNERPPLDSYGAEDVGEFFAVATEAFFDEPVALEANEPDLYDVLRDFYGQDPAARTRRGGVPRRPSAP